MAGKKPWVYLPQQKVDQTEPSRTEKWRWSWVRFPGQSYIYLRKEPSNKRRNLENPMKACRRSSCNGDGLWRKWRSITEETLAEEEEGNKEKSEAEEEEEEGRSEWESTKNKKEKKKLVGEEKRREEKEVFEFANGGGGLPGSLPPIYYVSPFQIITRIIPSSFYFSHFNLFSFPIIILLYYSTQLNLTTKIQWNANYLLTFFIF